MVVGDVATGTELAIVGAGSGGYVAAIRAGQLGLDVTLIEEDAIGGVCLNYGCIPSKALISATDVAHEAGDAEEMGVYADPEVQMDEMKTWKDGVVDQLTGGVENLCEANGVNVVEGRAEFVDENTLRVAHGGEGQGSESYEFEHAIVATGSRPIEVPGFEFDGETVLSSRDVLDLETIPDSVVVVGAGYIGMELSTVLAKLGTDVQVVEMLDDVLPGYESDLVRPVKRRAADLGIEFSFGEAAAGWAETDDGIVVTTETEEGEESTYEAEKAIVAVGRTPVTDTLNLEAIGLEPNDDGFLETDHEARTDVDHVFAIGDVAGEPMLAHKASAEGAVAAEVIAGEPSALDHQAIPAAVFTDPEIGTVGMTEAEAEDAGFEPAVGKFRFGANGRALTTGHPDGFVRIVADEDSGFVLGAQVVGPDASELIAELGLAVEMGATLEDVARTIHTHPTLSESVMEAAEHALGHAIHTLNR
ncbi:Pyruvate/2-oxoglutarate dehydrogenase complex, dihydrolipoamide dehydrogenase (E3) component or related enzyme [Halanaeroarchaeum sp. HSR-CO]|uniref:dihydrolipoyl dehydrogenase n=1 Tax=Halanaeroarchaeum sp. HSR-CO TaxID=2866382 RepID=UPI00217E6862|nr:dihydrolipoyl dehydrogenase [Halanaeroarchaeum sp. HSR-CO]UWG48947.1 Pyruvate/2-oxoglutarate dehydrogenase complex, dihydrolipoamide dehydrogenase (E3) component or related enzyme [Halanaeroarchaeum sp. HSR-CO]